MEMHVLDGGRFIPACAGNAKGGVAVICALAVHPRVCGERGLSGAKVAADNGSSPRVRGTLRRGPSSHTSCRFIPACAGNASSQ